MKVLEGRRGFGEGIFRKTGCDEEKFEIGGWGGWRGSNGIVLRKGGWRDSLDAF
jgi:hypothetical protein